MSISLAKSSAINLSKEAPGLNHAIVGLGWDPVGADEPSEKKGVFGGIFGRKPQKVSETLHDIDCDAFMILLTDDKMASNEDCVYYARKSHRSGAINHTGDNLTGDGDGDDEQIICNLNEVPKAYNKIVVAVNIYNGVERKQHFGLIKNAFVRIVDGKTEKEICRFDISNNPEYSGKTTMVFGELIRSGSDWQFKAIGEGKNWERISDATAYYRR